MPYNHVFLLSNGGEPIRLYDSYEETCHAIRKMVNADPENAYLSVEVWKNSLYHDDGRRPSKGWTWREFLMMEHLYVEGKRLQYPPRKRY